MSETQPIATIRAITASQTILLRRELLRPDRPPSESVYVGDDDATTEHWGAVVRDSLIAVASLYHEPLPESSDPHAWRLRGMAVSSAFQGWGYGKQLLNQCLESVANHGGSVLWCNARATAVVFYQSAGFQTVGDEFTIPTVGPHYVMVYAIHAREDRVAI